MDTLKQDTNYDVVFRLMRELYQYNKRAEELEEFGIDLYKLQEAAKKEIAAHIMIIDGSLNSKIIAVVLVLGLGAEIEREFISSRTTEA
jgi:hypothetical protein